MRRAWKWPRGEPEGPGEGAGLIRGRLDRGSVLNDAEDVSWSQTHRHRLSFTRLSCHQSWNQQAVLIPRMTRSLSIPSQAFIRSAAFYGQRTL